MTNSLAATLTAYQERNNQQLKLWLDKIAYQDQKLTQAMSYGLLLGGKRARPYLTYITGEMLQSELQAMDTAAAAVECIHAYSLIHDDLPAMDDDNLRRGQPTCHIEFDEASAILTGDALQTLAFDILANGPLAKHAEAYRIHMIRELAAASGASGMCMGQALDLEAEGKSITLEHLEAIHKHKTGALIKCAIRVCCMILRSVILRT